MSERWWERYPARYDSELEELQRAGFRFAVDESAKQAGYLRIDVFPQVHAKEVHVVAFFPDLYPWFRFEVKAPEEDLLHHQHPFEKTLCMIPRDTVWWRPGTDRLAHFLRDRLALVIDSGVAQEANDNIAEEPQGEPFTDYYRYLANAIVLIDGQWRVSSDRRFGSAVVGIEEGGAKKPPPLLRGAILELADERGTVIYRASEEIRHRFPRRLDARWSQLPEPPRSAKQDQLFEMVAEGDERAHKNSSHKVQGGRLSVRIGLFPEEHHWRGQGDASMGQGWLVACRFDGDSFQQTQAGRGRHKGSTITRTPAPKYYLARVGRATLDDIVERAPELRPLRSKTISIVGLGCIGGPSTLEFARAGTGELRIVDHDFVDPATAVRWPAGLTAAGLSKAQVMERVIKEDYPYTKVRAWPRRLGNVNEGQIDDWELVDELVGGSDLIYDASAEAAVQQFLSTEARRCAVPYIAVFGTEGGWGGTIIRIWPDRTEGCWLCYQYARETGDIPAPAHEHRTVAFQPQGCADPTFTGAGFDLAEMALSGVRLAVSTLCAGVENAYPPADWDVGILNLRDEKGRLIPPAWATYPLRRHPRCPACAASN
jgi:molybdopterin/thiamine biosynthesis adenylyltransferase